MRMRSSTQTLQALSLLVATVSLTTGLALAERSDVTIMGPGVSMQKQTGLFGTGKTEYKDVLGNRYVTRKGLFGRQHTEGSALGASVKGYGNNITVTAPNGNTILHHSHHWWSGDKTVINANGLFGKTP